jgi:dihydroorotase
MPGLFPVTTLVNGIPAWHDGEFTYGGGQMRTGGQKHSSTTDKTPEDE